MINPEISLSRVSSNGLKDKSFKMKLNEMSVHILTVAKKN